MNSSRSPPHAPPASEKPTPKAECTVFLTSPGPAGALRCSGIAARCARTAPGPSTRPVQHGTTAQPSGVATPSPWPQTSPPRPDCLPRSESPLRNSPSSSSAKPPGQPKTALDSGRPAGGDSGRWADDQQLELAGRAWRGHPEGSTSGAAVPDGNRGRGRGPPVIRQPMGARPHRSQDAPPAPPAQAARQRAGRPLPCMSEPYYAEAFAPMEGRCFRMMSRSREGGPVHCPGRAVWRGSF
jgi:hypothetical protein